MNEEAFPALTAQGFEFSLIDRTLYRLEGAAVAMLDLERQVQEVETQGMTDAVPWWKDGKYLVMVHPQTNGERVREYIGANPSKVQVALLKIENKKRYAELSQQLAIAQRTYHMLEYELTGTLKRITNQR
jgi:hypothetical protein